MVGFWQGGVRGPETGLSGRDRGGAGVQRLGCLARSQATKTRTVFSRDRGWVGGGVGGGVRGDVLKWEKGRIWLISGVSGWAGWWEA